MLCTVFVFLACWCDANRGGTRFGDKGKGGVGKCEGASGGHEGACGRMGKPGGHVWVLFGVCCVCA